MSDAAHALDEPFVDESEPGAIGRFPLPWQAQDELNDLLEALASASSRGPLVAAYNRGCVNVLGSIDKRSEPEAYQQAVDDLKAAGERYEIAGIQTFLDAAAREQPAASAALDGADQSSPKVRFAPVAIDDVVLTAEPPWLIEGIVPARGLACIVGPPKSGKSFLTTDMLCSVARGALYAGRATLQGAVIYLTGEGVTGFKRRLVAMRRHLDIEGQGVPFFMIENVPDLGSETTDLPQLLAELDAFIARSCPEGPVAIVLDTLARCMGEGDENSARDMGRFVNRCGAIERHFGCVVVVVHHVGKDPARGGRGSNALNGAADVTMMVEKSEAFSTVRIEEMKDGPEGQEWRFKLIPYVLSETSDTSSETMPEVSTCVVELLSEPTIAKPSETKKPKVPKGVAGDLLKVIRRAVEESGERNVDSVSVPNNVRAVSRANLKRYCATMDWQDPDAKPDAFRAMLNKTLSALRAADLIGFDREWVWLI